MLVHFVPGNQVQQRTLRRNLLLADFGQGSLNFLGVDYLSFEPVQGISERVQSVLAVMPMPCADILRGPTVDS